MKKNIVYVLHDLKIGGVEIALLSALPKLIEKYNFQLICLGFIDPEIKSKLSIEELNSIHEFKPYSLLSYLKAYRFVKKFNTDLIIASLWRSNLFTSIAKTCFPKIVYISFKHSTRFAHLADKLSNSISSRIADEVWVDSTSTANFIESASKNRINTIKISFILRRLGNVHRKPIDIPRRFLFIGRISAVKRIDLVIRFVEDMTAKGIPIHIDLYGSDEENLWRDVYAEQIHSKDLKISYKGATDYKSIEYIYSDYSYYIQMSDYEGMAISVMEAMMAGLVCFVRPVGEIGNYSKHLVNAIHLKNQDEDSWNNFISESVMTLTNESELKEMGNSASSQWKDVKLYRDHICENIDRNLLT